MKKYLFLALMSLMPAAVKAESSFDRVKIVSFSCEYGKAVVHLRSLDADRALYLARNSDGEPQAIRMLEEHCRGLTKNLGNRFSGNVLDLEFFSENFSRNESVEEPPRNPCRSARTKCDDEGPSVMRTFRYVRIQTVIEGYRFFREYKIGPVE